MLIGVTTIAIFAAVAMVSWALGVRTLPDTVEPGLAGDAASSFSQLTTGGVLDTARVVRLGELGADLDESSGLAVSRARPEVHWTHNDGGEGRLYAIRADGSAISSVEVDGVDIDDWEDIDLARCPADGPEEQDCLYVGDFGDNDADRDRYAIDIVVEPAAETGGTVPVLRRLWFRYPEGPADTEALAVLDSGEALLATKGEDGPSRLYRLSLAQGPEDEIREATLVGTVPVVVNADRDRITAAAISPDESVLAIRNHHAVYLFDIDRPLGAPLLCEIGALQPQGEALDFIQPSMLVLTSEQVEGRAPIVRLRCP